jgi:phosphocarrier protein
VIDKFFIQYIEFFIFSYSFIFIVVVYSILAAGIYIAMVKSFNRLSREVVITNELGLHARSAARIAKLAQNGESKIWIIKEGAKADATSVIDILTLCCEKGSKITIEIDNQSDHAILKDLVQLVENGFGE